MFFGQLRFEVGDGGVTVIERLEAFFLIYIVEEKGIESVRFRERNLVKLHKYNMDWWCVISHPE